jgi:dephospho-CoA kinase
LSTDPVFLGFAGRIGAGKTSAAEYLHARRGFQYARYSKVLREWFSLESERRGLQEIGAEVMRTGLQSELNTRLIAGLNRSTNAAIDGLRHPLDFETLVSEFGQSFALIFVDARPEIRFERLRHRYANYDAFCAADAHEVEGQIEILRPLASHIVSNESSLGTLYTELDDWIANHSGRNQP